MMKILSRIAFVFSLGIVGIESYVFVTQGIIHADVDYRFQFELKYMGALLLAWVLMHINFFYPFKRKEKKKVLEISSGDGCMPRRENASHSRDTDYPQVFNQAEYSSADVVPILPSNHRV